MTFSFGEDGNLLVFKIFINNGKERGDGEISHLGPDVSGFDVAGSHGPPLPPALRRLSFTLRMRFTFSQWHLAVINSSFHRFRITRLLWLLPTLAAAAAAVALAVSIAIGSWFRFR